MKKSTTYNNEFFYIFNYKKFNFKLLLGFIGMIIMFTCLIFTFNVEGNVESRDKVFTTVKLEEGDSLWSVAREYYSDEYEDYNELIDEIKDINNMIDDNVKKGCYIIVPYYIDESNK